jgi:hypothetical protein
MSCGERVLYDRIFLPRSTASIKDSSSLQLLSETSDVMLSS